MASCSLGVHPKVFPIQHARQEPLCQGRGSNCWLDQVASFHSGSDILDWQVGRCPSQYSLSPLEIELRCPNPAESSTQVDNLEKEPLTFAKSACRPYPVVSPFAKMYVGTSGPFEPQGPAGPSGKSAGPKWKVSTTVGSSVMSGKCQKGVLTENRWNTTFVARRTFDRVLARHSCRLLQRTVRTGQASAK